MADDDRTSALKVLRLGLSALEESLGKDDYRTREARAMFAEFRQRWSMKKSP